MPFKLIKMVEKDIAFSCEVSLLSPYYNLGLLETGNFDTREGRTQRNRVS
jgi:hypothetical protein